MSPFQMTFVALLVAGMTISIYHRRRAGYARDPSVTPRDEGQFILIARVLGGAALWLGILAYAINPTWLPWATSDLPAWLRWTGAGMAALSLPLFWWVFASLGENVTGTVATRDNHTLVDSGPYRYVRHPLYTVGALYFTGLILLSGSWILGFAFVATFAILVARTPIEEAKLVERFGERYVAYAKRTGRYLPRVSGRR